MEIFLNLCVLEKLDNQSLHGLLLIYWHLCSMSHRKLSVIEPHRLSLQSSGFQNLRHQVQIS